MPARHITIAAARVRNDRFTCVTLYDLPRDHIESLVSAFEKTAPDGPWSEEAVFSALLAGTDWEIMQGAGLSEGEIDDLLAQKPVVGPALWYLKYRNHGHVAWPPEGGMIVAVDEDRARVMIRPIDDEFMAWVQRSATRELGPTVH